MFEMKIGEGGAVSWGPGLFTCWMSEVIRFSVYFEDSHLTKSWSIWDFAIWNLTFWL